MQYVAALFVEFCGVYFGVEGVIPWSIHTDARLYPGPLPVVAHPPCERWGRYWHGGPSAKVRREKGDDGGCFAAALAAVRAWGGVLEHPEASAAWDAFGLLRPPKSGGWLRVQDGWTCCVEQGHYGHRARKATWLYTTHPNPPELKWGPAPKAERLERGYHSAEERRRAREAGEPMVRRINTSREAARTPEPFRDLLIELARGCARSEVQCAS